MTAARREGYDDYYYVERLKRVLYYLVGVCRVPSYPLAVGGSR